MNQIVQPFRVDAPNMRPDGMEWADLRAMSRWVVWMNAVRGGKPTKVPHCPFDDGAQASTNSPETWGTYAQAEAFCPALQADGVGIVLGDMGGTVLAGIDLDTCRNPATQEIDEWAAAIIRRFKTYAEISPSGEGVKVYFTMSATYVPALLEIMGSATTGKQFKREGADHPPGIEFYFTARFFAFTGNHVPGTPTAVHKAFLSDLTQLIQVIGPAFAREGREFSKSSSPAPISRPETLPLGSAPKPAMTGPLWDRIRRSAYFHAGLNRLLSGDFTAMGDASRSAKAFAMGGALLRAQYSYEEMVQAVSEWHETAEWAVEKGKPNNEREFRRIWDRASRPEVGDAPFETGITVGGETFPLTEDGIARAFAANQRDALRYCHHAGSWYRWTATVWKKEETDLAFEWSRLLCRKLADEPGIKDRVKTTLAKASTASAIERFARSDRMLAVTSDTWDRDIWLLGTPIGTVDLRKGELLEPRPEDHITRSTAVGPSNNPDCPLWLGFLKEATGGNYELIQFLQTFCGYLLTGSTREHALLFIYGPGGNGKSVFLNTIASILGDYATTAPMDTLTASGFDKHPTDMAMLRGARLVSASETEEGRPWAEAKIKQLTGGDPITARFMRQDFFTFVPEFKLTVIGNHKPILRNVDEAARRRFNVLPFENTPTNPDKELEEKLRHEWPGILRWMIRGCLIWQKDGLIRPKAVTEATAEYLSEQDSVKQWIEECCETGGRGISDTVANLFKSWSDYAIANGEKPGTSRWFSQTLQRHGSEPVKNTPGHFGKRGFLRISVKHQDTSQQWQNREAD